MNFWSESEQLVRKFLLIHLISKLFQHYLELFKLKTYEAFWTNNKFTQTVQSNVVVQKMFEEN